MRSQKNDHEIRISLVEQSIGHVSETLARIEKRFDDIDRKFDKIDQKFEVIDQKFDKKFDTLMSRLWLNFFFTVGGFATVLTLLAKIHKFI